MEMIGEILNESKNYLFNLELVNYYLNNAMCVIHIALLTTSVRYKIGGLA